MFLFKAISLIATALLLAWIGFSIIGGGPLLLLGHRTPNDFRMVRGFFDVHYRVSMTLASIGAFCFAIADRFGLAAAMAGVATFGFVVRRAMLPRMDRLRDLVTKTDAIAVRAFRKVHVTGLALNIVVLALMVFTVSRPSLALFTCIEFPQGCQGAACRQQCSV